MVESNLSHHFLIAMPGLDDRNFAQSVTYICEHNEEGALGLIVNRPSDLQLSDVLRQMDIETSADQSLQRPVYFGGPISPERGFVLHGGDRVWDATMTIADGVYVTSSKDILSAIGRGEGPADFMLVLGYAGWGAGQLEQELRENVWLTVAANTELLFRVPPGERLTAAAALLGINLDQLSGDMGHA